MGRKFFFTFIAESFQKEIIASLTELPPWKCINSSKYLPLSGQIQQIDDISPPSPSPLKQGLAFHASFLQWRQFAWNVKMCLMCHRV